MKEKQIALDDMIEKMSDEDKLLVIKARRTAFVARFIVLRESKRSKAHRRIEMLEWKDDTTAEELYDLFKRIFAENRDNQRIVERDLRRAMAHVSRSVNYFVREYAARATKDFIGALYDYDHSNRLLFSSDEQPRLGGWRLPQDLERERMMSLVKRQQLPEDSAD